MPSSVARQRVTDQLDSIMASHHCQHSTILGDLNQPSVNRVFTELTVVHGITNPFIFPTHAQGGSVDPVLTDLPGDSVHCRRLDKIGISDHNAVLTEIGFNPTYEEIRQHVIWLWQRAMKLALAAYNVSAVTATLL